MQQPSDQPAPRAESPASLTDRIGALFDGHPMQKASAPAPAEDTPAEPQYDNPDQPAVEAEAADEDGASAPEPTAAAMEEIEFEGERFAVPPKLKDALLRQSDYTKKTQEVAEQKRLVEFQRQQVALAESERKFGELVRDQVTQMSQLDSALKQYEALDWRNLSTDDMIRYKVEIDQLKDRKASVERDVQGKHAQWQQEVQRAHADLLRQGMETVRKAIPGFSDATVAEIKDYALSEGYTPEEIGNILDPRQVKTLWEAAQYRKLQRGATTARAAVQQAKPIGKATPASNPMPQGTRDYLTYRKALERAGPKGSLQRQKVAEQRIASIFTRGL